MWTYKHPYTPEEQTKSYIEKRGRLALSRALNIGRVVGFVASGATMGYGHPSWKKLVEIAVKEAIKLAEPSTGREYSGASRAAVAGLKRIQANGDLDKQAVQALGLAASLSKLVGKDDEFRKKIAGLFSENRNVLRDPRDPKETNRDATSAYTLKQADFASNAEPLRALISDLRVSRLLTLNYDCEIEEEFHRLYRTTGTSRDQVKPRVYRVENGEKQTDAPETAFDVLCGNQFERALDVPRRVEYTDGTSRSVLSVSMSSDNIADLVNFSVQPRQFVGQVVHLHGRYDKPKDMVLTDDDYRRTYLKSDEQAQTFEEALSALLTGNDILFVGTAMREADILRPLRQFISQDKTPDFAKRFVYALLENRVTLDESWLRNPHGIKDLEALGKDFTENHLTHPRYTAPTECGAAMADYCEDENECLRLHSEFGVLALFHGGQRLRTVLLAIKLLEAARPVTKSNGKSGADRKSVANYPVSGKARPAFIAAAKALLEQLQDTDQDTDSLLSHSESRILQGFLDRLHNDLRNNKVSAALPETALLRALANEVRSRALTLALMDLEDNRSEWWEDWRQGPKERSSKFRPQYLESDSDRKVPTVARHRPVYLALPEDDLDFRCIRRLRELSGKVAQEIVDARKQAISIPSVLPKLQGGHIRTYNTNDVSFFTHLKTKTPHTHTARDFDAVPPRRIVRCCMPRGAGKGSLLHILQQPVHGSDRLHLDTLLDDLENAPNSRYHGAFCLHLSFSMEFASVISALSEFVESALIGAMVEHPDKVLKALEDRLDPPLPGYEDSFLGLLHSKHQSGLKSALEEYLNRPAHAEKIAKRDTCAQTIRKELKNNYWNRIRKARGALRLHRLDALRMRISAFTDIVDLLSDQNLRLLIVMSGMDKLCDENGTAYNPMFRELFRQLTGCGAKYASESDVTAPIDLLLISGTRHSPIRYLTDEQTKTEVREATGSPSHSAPLDFNFRSLERGKDEPPVFLQDWPILPSINIDERYWVNGSAGEFQTALTQHITRKDYPHIEKACRQGVALFSWCAGAYQAMAEGTGKNEQNRTSTFLRRLDDAAMRGQMPAVLRELLEVHKIELRAWGAKLADELDPNTTPDPDWPDPAWKDARQPAPRPPEHPTPGPLSEPANRMVELAYLVLSHLALFPMPIEPRVLYGCNEVRDALARICDPAGFKQNGDQYRAKLRLRRLRVLNQLLDYLHKTHLVIAVHGKPYENALIGKTAISIGQIKRSADDIHTRFTIQHQLRDFVARLMDLSVPDQGERNFFQVSIYCDQPKDLPSPNADHYRMVRGIMEQQITQVRNTTWCLMQLAHDQKHAAQPPFARLTKEDRDLVNEGLGRRFYRVAGNEPEFDPDLPAIHAVPQRVRALYGLLRGGFSIGTISRLTSLDELHDDQPYERFRGWLRGVTNAAIGWDYAIERLFLDDNGEPDVAKTQTTLNALHDFVKTPLTIAADSKTMIRLPKMLNRPLYRDEIGWLLNERGLTALVTGHIFDAIPLFQRALDAMHHDDAEGFYDPSLHAAVRRVRLNLSIALIERGQLGRAKSMLTDLLLPNGFSTHEGSQVSWIAEGYLGLIDHLGGNHAVAEKRYTDVITRSQDRNMLRLAAIFLRHYADLKRRQGHLKQAKTLVNQAVSIALKSAQRDIYHLSRISQAAIELKTHGPGEFGFQDKVTEAYNYGQSMGIPRLECEALRLQSEIMLRQGERMLGGKFASLAAAIANRHGLRLTKLSALFSYGVALHQRGQTKAAHQILYEATREAERRGYQNIQQTEILNEIVTY